MRNIETVYTLKDAERVLRKRRNRKIKKLLATLLTLSLPIVAMVGMFVYWLVFGYESSVGLVVFGVMFFGLIKFGGIK